MRYSSNLCAPLLRRYFKLLNPPIQMMGHDIPSDPDFEPNCGFFSDDEAALLHHVAKQVPGTWIDVGARFGWTAAHIMEADCSCVLIDPEQAVLARHWRLKENLAHWWARVVAIQPRPFQDVWVDYKPVGIVIDGCHDEPEPTLDAIHADSLLDGRGVILLHDFHGRPIQRGVEWLLDHGWHARIYSTPNGVALCWKLEGFDSPAHLPDPAIDWEQVRRTCCGEFDFTRTK